MPRNILQNVFQWLTFAKQRLFLEKVAEAAILGPDKNDRLLSDHTIPSPYEMEESCSGLLTIIPSRGKSGQNRV